MCVSAAPAPWEGGTARSRQVTGRHESARVCMHACLCVKSFFPPKERVLDGSRRGEGERRISFASVHPRLLQARRAGLLISRADDLRKLITHMSSRSYIGLSISVSDNTCILADFNCSSGKRASISSEKAVTPKEFWLHFKD